MFLYIPLEIWITFPPITYRLLPMSWTRLSVNNFSTGCFYIPWLPCDWTDLNHLSLYVTEMIIVYYFIIKKPICADTLINGSEFKRSIGVISPSVTCTWCVHLPRRIQCVPHVCVCLCVGLAFERVGFLGWTDKDHSLCDELVLCWALSRPSGHITASCSSVFMGG